MTSSTARISWNAEGASLEAGGRVYRADHVRHPNGETDTYATLATLAVLAEAEGQARVRRCASCAHFRFSGMTYQMSAGTRGYCSRVGFRNRRALVNLDHVCGEHEPVAGWPGDLDAALAARLALAERGGSADRGAAFAGAMVGLAVGDALGYPAEFRTRAQILECFGPGGLDDLVALHDLRWPPRPAVLGARHPAGTFTDDTQMTIAVAEGLVEAGQGDLDTLMGAVAARFVDWSRSPDNNRAPGATCMVGCAQLAAGVPWRLAGVPDSKGCGSAMRVAPIGLYFWRDRAALLGAARASSLLTHGHEAAVESAAAAALLIALALEKRTPAEMHAALVEECAPGSRDLAARLSQVPALLDADPELALSVRGLGEGWVAEEAVASALWCFWRSPEDYRRTVLAAANTDGDSDSIASIAGGISGAFNGLEAIPSEWRARVEEGDRLLALASALMR